MKCPNRPFGQPGRGGRVRAARLKYLKIFYVITKKTPLKVPLNLIRAKERLREIAGAVFMVDVLY